MPYSHALSESAECQAGKWRVQSLKSLVRLDQASSPDLPRAKRALAIKHKMRIENEKA